MGLPGAWFRVFGGALSDTSHLPDQIKELEQDCSTLRAANTGLEEESRKLQMKVEIVNELYQQQEMALQR